MVIPHLLSIYHWNPGFLISFNYLNSIILLPILLPVPVPIPILVSIPVHRWIQWLANSAKVVPITVNRVQKFQIYHLIYLQATISTDSD